jgi:hypothetical protein
MREMVAVDALLKCPVHGRLRRVAPTAP